MTKSPTLEPIKKEIEQFLADLNYSEWGTKETIDALDREKVIKEVEKIRKLINNL